jgi:hypothetical protein
MSSFGILILFISFAGGLFLMRELKILAEGDVERYQVVRACSLLVMTVTPYFLSEPWNSAAVLLGVAGLIVSFLLPKNYS